MFSSVNFDKVVEKFPLYLWQKGHYMLHPAVAHFAISLPIISLVLGLLYLFRPTEVMSKVSTRFLVFAAIFAIAAYFSGKHDASEVFSSLTPDAKALLIQHAKLGLYLAIGMGVAAVVKMVGCLKNMFKVELIAIVLLLVLSGATLFQGKMGGELTFEYGAHVSGYADGQKCIKEAAEMEDDDDEDEED